MLELRLTGVDQLLINLKKVQSKLRRKFILKGMRKGAKIIVRDARNRVTDRTGRLKRSIGTITVPKRKSFNTILDIGPRVKTSNNINNREGLSDEAISNSNDGFYGKWVEVGNRRIKNKRPFLRPAFDSRGDAALEAAMAEMLSQLEKAL